MQELGMSEDIIRSNLDESLKSPATLISPHANASDSSSRKSSSFDSKHHSWNSEVPPRSLASGTGVSHQDMPPISRERMTLLDSVRFRVTELANAGGPFLKGLVERYAHLLNNAVFVERYLVSRDSNVEVTARKVSCSSPRLAHWGVGL